ncbi:MAG: glycosyltransferase family 39 protein [Anaerolineae bacterium]|nr:glycosyltransferase family 39 protein [Anaerolineae bacterium]
MALSRREIAIIIALFLVTRLALLVAGTLVITYLPENETLGDELKHLLDGGPALDMWYRWDAGFYATIATEGYDWFNDRQPAADMAFLPVYPAAVRAVMAVTGCFFTPYQSTCATVSGLIVSNVALLGAAFLLYDLARRQFDKTAALSAVILLMITPNAIFLSGVYTEALFLALCLLTFWLLEREQFALALIPACFAALTRSVGIALYPALLWYVWRETPPSLRLPRLLLAHLPLIVFAGYVLLAGNYVGEPLAYFRSYEVIWGRDVTRSPWETLLVYFSGEPVSLYGWQLSWIDLIAFVGYLLLDLIALRRKPAWGLFALAAILIPFASGTLVAMPRFGAVIFPFYILLGAWARSKPASAPDAAPLWRWLNAYWRPVLVYGACLILGVLFIARFVAGYWIA